MKKEIKMEREGFKTVWRNGKDKDLVDVDVFDAQNILVLEWTYGKVCGRQLLANAIFWMDQVILQVKYELDNK